MSSCAERWKSVPGREGFYSVSSLGRVRSEERVIIRKDGHRRSVKEVILRPARHRGGHLHVTLCRGGEAITMMVHRLVLEAFVRSRPEGMECRHLNGDPTDNRLGNLAWGTRAENEADKIRHGTSNRGERQWLAKLNKRSARIICRMAVSEKWPYRYIENAFGTSNQTVSHIKLGQRWGWATTDIRNPTD